MTIEEMVERFQCPGCVLGSDTTCGQYDYNTNEFRCVSHVPGTSIGPFVFALGMPKGFNKPRWEDPNRKGRRNEINIRLFQTGDHPEWDHLNVPVWAMEQDGFLFVGTFAPRIDLSWVDVIEGGTLALAPKAIDVSAFIDEID